MKTWTVEYMVRERRGDYLAAVEDLEASHGALVTALRKIADQADRAALVEPRHGRLLVQTLDFIAKEAQAALKAAEEEANG